MTSFRLLLRLSLLSALILNLPAVAASDQPDTQPEAKETLNDILYRLHKFLLVPPNAASLLAALNRWQRQPEGDAAARKAYLESGLAKGFRLACPAASAETDKSEAPLLAQKLEILEHQASPDQHHYKVRLELQPDGSKTPSCSETYDLTVVKAQHPMHGGWEWVVSEATSATRRSWRLVPIQPQSALQLQKLAEQLKIRATGYLQTGSSPYRVDIQSGSLLLSHPLSQTLPESWGRRLTIPGQIRLKYRTLKNQAWAETGLGNQSIADVSAESNQAESVVESLTSRYSGLPKAPQPEAWTVEIALTLADAPKLMALARRVDIQEFGLFLDQVLIHRFSLAAADVQDGLLTLGGLNQQQAQDLAWALKLNALPVALILKESRLEPVR